MAARNCVVPLVVRLQGIPDDDSLAEASEAIARTVAGRLSEANRVIAAREGWPSWDRHYAAPALRFSGIPLDDDLQRRVGAAIERGVARAIAGGPAVARTGVLPQFLLVDYPPRATRSTLPAAHAAPRHRRRPSRGWRVLVARDFYTTVDKYTEFFDKAKNTPVKLFDLYSVMGGERRRVALWLVEVDRGYWFRDLLGELSARATELSGRLGDQLAASIVGATETDRKNLIEIDGSGVAQQTIPDLSANSQHLSSVHDETYILPGARVFVATMILPHIRLTDYLRLEPEIQLSLRNRDLEFLVSTKGFESWSQVSWTEFVGAYGDLPGTLHILPMEVLRRAPWPTLSALVEDFTQVSVRQPDARNWWQFQPLNRLFLGTLPDPAKQAVAGYANSTTLALSDDDRWGNWQPGWRAAILWAKFEITDDQRFFAHNRVNALRIADRLIAHLANFEDRLEWWLEIRHILEQSFTTYTPQAGVRTLFDLVMEEMEAREGGRWFELLLDKLGTNDGLATRAFLEYAFASTKYNNHPRIVAMRNSANANWRDALLNAYFPDTNAIWLNKDGARRVGKGGVVADAYPDYSEEHEAQMLVESRRAEFEKALETERTKLLGEIVNGKISRDFDTTEFTNEAVKRAAQSIPLSNSDFEKVTVTVSLRVTKVELVNKLGLEHYMVTWNVVQRINDGPWEDIPDSERPPTTELDFEWILRMWETSRNVGRIARIGLAAAIVGVVIIAWEAGLVSALVRLAGGATVVLSSIALLEIITLVRKGRKFTLEDFVWAAIEGYINALTFRFAGLGGRAIAARIGTSSVTKLVGGWIAERLFTGVVGGGAGGALTVFSHGIAEVLLGNGQFPTLGDFVQGMALGALMGVVGEFVVGPALQGAFRLGSQTALSTIEQAVKLIRDSGTSPAEYAARIGEALGGLRQRLGQFLEGKSVEEIMAGVRERLAGVGDALAKAPGAAKEQLDLILFRRIFEIGEFGLSRAEVDGLERLLAATRSGAGGMTRDELLFFLNGLARDRAQTAQVLGGLGRLAEDRVAALVASGQLDGLVGAGNLLRHLAAGDVDLIWEVWNGGSFRFRIGDFEAWLGRLAGHGNDQQIFALQVLRRLDQDITPEGVAQALDKCGLTNETVAGLDRLYGAFDDPATADGIMAGVARDNARAYLLFLATLRQEGVNELADHGFLRPLSAAPRVLEFAGRGQNLAVLRQVVTMRGATRDVAREVLEGVERFFTREPNLAPDQQVAALRQLFGSAKVTDIAQLSRLLDHYQSGERLTRLLEVPEVLDGAHLERLADALRQPLPNATTGGLSEEALARLSDPAVLREIEPTAALQTSGRVAGLEDWVQINSPKSAHELAEAGRELREARRLANANPGSVVRVGREARAPIRPGTTEPLPEFDISIEPAAGAVQRTVEVTTVEGRVARVGDLTNGVRHAADKVAERLREGVPIPGAHDVIIEAELAVGRRAVGPGTIEILPDGRTNLITGDGRVLPQGNLLDRFEDNLSTIQNNALLDQITLVDRAGHPFATYDRADAVWTRRR